MLFLGGSVEGVHRGSPWTGPYSSPWTRSVWGSMDRGSVFSGHPLDYAVRCKSCRVCDYAKGQEKGPHKHKCSQNWTGL